MNDKPKPMSEWLKKITRDQNLNSLGDLVLTKLTSVGKRWFASRTIQPIGQIAWYDPATGKWVLGVPGNFTNESEFTTTSQAALTLTCPAGYRIEVTYAAAWNATQVSTTTLSATIGGNTFNMLTGASGSTQIVGTLLGAYQTTAFANPSLSPQGLSAGDSMTLTINTFAAGNNTEHIFVYKLFKVA